MLTAPPSYGPHDVALLPFARKRQFENVATVASLEAVMCKAPPEPVPFRLSPLSCAMLDSKVHAEKAGIAEDMYTAPALLRKPTALE